MPLSRSRAAAVVALVMPSLLVASLFAAAIAADSPEGAVDEILDDAASIFVEQMGADGIEVDLDDLQVEVLERDLEVVSNDGQTAVVRVMATLKMSMPEDQIEGLVRAMLEADRAPDEPVTDDELAYAMSIMGNIFNGTQSLDEEVTVVLEDGEWVFSSGLGLGDEPDPGFEPSVSTEGLCAFAAPEELSALGGLQYDSSSGYGNSPFCQYSTADYDAFHSTQVQLVFDQEAEGIAGSYEAGEQLEVGGSPAFATGPDGYVDMLVTQVGPDTLMVTVTMPDPPPDSFDWLTQATLVAELFIPRVPDARSELNEPTVWPEDDLAAPPEPTPAPTPEVPLCDVEAARDELNAAFGLEFSDVSSDGVSCQLSSVPTETGFQLVFATLVEGRLDDYLAWIGEHEELTVAGLRAIATSGQTIVELPDRGRMLAFSASLTGLDEGTPVTDAEVVEALAAHILPRIPEAEPKVYLCDYVDLDAVNALGILEYSTTFGLVGEQCSLIQEDTEQGYHSLTIRAEAEPIDQVRQWYPDGTDVTVAGMPGYAVGPELYVETSSGPIAFSALLPFDGTLAETVAGMDPSKITIPVAELVVAAMEADSTAE